MAHELIHGYNFFLQGHFRDPTPAPAVFGPNGNTLSGDSGRRWESLVFGGYVNMQLYPDNPQNIEAIVIRDADKRHVWQLKSAYIMMVLKHDFHLAFNSPVPELPLHLDELSLAKEIRPVGWEQFYFDAVPPLPQNQSDWPREYSDYYIGLLTGKDGRYCVGYDVMGKDLVVSCTNPARRLAVTRVPH